ncbi:hypothetical protein DFH09DRAFT_1378307 [Mycena vulgaris]|nr:hypothetical protein DFH09DRAFT_1378307 [Mycena vulgaris]
MAFPSLSSIYWLICVLCLAHLALGMWTIHEFGFPDTGEYQLILMLYAALTIPMVYQMASYGRLQDDALTRSNAEAQRIVSTVYPLVCVLCLLEIVFDAWKIVALGVTERAELVILSLYAAWTNLNIMVYILKLDTRRREGLSRVDNHIRHLTFLLTSWVFATLDAAVFLFIRDPVTVRFCVAERFISPRCSIFLAAVALLLIAIIVILSYRIFPIIQRAIAIHGDAMVPLPPATAPAKLVPAWHLGNVRDPENAKLK